MTLTTFRSHGARRIVSSGCSDHPNNSENVGKRISGATKKPHLGAETAAEAYQSPEYKIVPVKNYPRWCWVSAPAWSPTWPTMVSSDGVSTNLVPWKIIMMTTIQARFATDLNRTATSSFGHTATSKFYGVHRRFTSIHSTRNMPLVSVQL